MRNVVVRHRQCLLKEEPRLLSMHAQGAIYNLRLFSGYYTHRVMSECNSSCGICASAQRASVRKSSDSKARLRLDAALASDLRGITMGSGATGRPAASGPDDFCAIDA